MPVPTTPLAARVLLRDHAFTALRDAIVDGTLRPGEQLREGELREWIGVSRTPIREALMRLERCGLVVTRPGHSTTVSALDATAVRDAQPVVAAMHALAVRLAVPVLDADRVAAMRTHNEAFAAALERGDTDAALAADDALHEVCVTAAGNTVVGEVLEQYSPLLRRVERTRFSSAAGLESVALHRRMIDACAAGDPATAADLAHTTWMTLADAPSAQPAAAVSGGHGLVRAP
ncbi:GntR family transcriptional regulator [Streptomyces paludis]|uniref:GntR family transcriptional regulator n=1 Tax=Streptomyces paludis TaxID=2282738 RepID=A0A345HII0_9ACTN|nr:GntR family transcriptional regulator [Streptomyces paludis]AXG76504.1 GntR family transcriptional regulator [Streptomyces paludis]